jgi:hypothetical protein
MSFKRLPQNSKQLLDEIIAADNPADMLAKRFDGLTNSEDAELRSIIRELREEGFINVQWADNVPYFVTINNSARTYNERLQEYESEKRASVTIDQSVKIGNGNTICDSTIASLVQEAVSPKKIFWEKHPLLLGVIGAVIAGVILTFSFWGKIVAFIEGVF